MSEPQTPSRPPFFARPRPATRRTGAAGPAPPVGPPGRLSAPRPAHVLGWIALGGAAAALLVGLGLLGSALQGLPAIPPKTALWSFNRPPGIVFLDRTGRVIGRRGPLHGAPLHLSQTPAYLPRAFLAAEDHRFFTHHGLDLLGEVRALGHDLDGRRGALQGGSTLTQQLAKTLFLSPEQTLRRKIQEAILAVELEARLSKTEILELYLNRIYFGAGAYGVEAASEIYFGKPASRLTLAEAAFLAALPKAPTRFGAVGALPRACARSRHVLSRMRAEAWITGPQEAAALASPPVLAPASRSEGDFGYVFDLAAREAREAAPNTPDLVVQLSVDADLQSRATDAVRAAVESGADRGVSEGALVALAPDGGVLALVGGVDHRLSPFNRATEALRQPGSAFKPFVYAAALEAGLSPQARRPDRPVDVAGWRPRNAEGRYAGELTLSDALARSSNVVAVRVSQEIGPDRVAALARRFGLLNMPARPSPPIALGAYETTLLDLASAYLVFQQEGRRQAPWLIGVVFNAKGDRLFTRRAAAPDPVFDPDSAARITAMMRQVIVAGTGRAADIGRPAAGKTGTSQAYRDAWFVGYTPDLLAAVWLGDDRGRPMKAVTGGSAPAQAWRRFMSAAEAGRPALEFAGPAKPLPAEPVPADLPPVDSAPSETMNADADAAVDGASAPAETDGAPAQGGDPPGAAPTTPPAKRTTASADLTRRSPAHAAWADDPPAAG